MLLAPFVAVATFIVAVAGSQLMVLCIVFVVATPPLSSALAAADAL